MNNMLNYKLCKQLKNAGFPQDKTRFSYVFPPKCPDDYTNIMEVNKPQGIKNLLAAGYEIVACPFLEELIDICGECLTEMHHMSEDYWVVLGLDDKKLIKVDGKLLEAVAKLYIRLNEKDN